MDGLSRNMGDWWFNMRCSDTEPMLRASEQPAWPGKRQFSQTAGMLPGPVAHRPEDMASALVHVDDSAHLQQPGQRRDQRADRVVPARDRVIGGEHDIQRGHLEIGGQH